MDDIMYILIGVFIGGLSSGLISLYFKKSLQSKYETLIERQRIAIEDVQKNAERVKKDAELETKDIRIQAKAEVEKEINERKLEITKIEKRLRHKEESLDRKMDQQERRDTELSRKEKESSKKEQQQLEREKQYDNMIKEEREILEKIAAMSSEDAKNLLLNKVSEEAKFETAKLAMQIERDMLETVDKKACDIIGQAIQKYASDYVADATVTAVSLPNDEMKGRIIGREGRNIRALEAATGIDFIIDDTPEAVILSGFDPVRREVARLTLERLIADGRIHPARIEEIAEKMKKEVNNIIKEEGEKAVFDLGLSGIHPDLIRMLGRLKYRTSFGQNVLQHSREVAYLAGMMAGELGVNVKLARRAGLLHDLGKAVDHEFEGGHHEIGAVFARKYGEDDRVVNAMLVHHGDGEPNCVESALVTASDALSAARPGVRRESIENYIKRLEKLEEIAMAHQGVEKCYAIQAGRELRIIVKPEELTEEMSFIMSKDIAKKIEAEMNYPGQIKVTVIRESRFVEYAK
ncbi:MAG: ribonuclease Y [Nitrospirae bacterium]|nr:ribonuclease Y [Nitrospirota bacterium]